MRLKEQYLESVDLANEAKAWAAVDLEEYGYWKLRYARNRWLQSVYDDEFARLWALEQAKDHEYD